MNDKISLMYRLVECRLYANNDADAKVSHVIRVERYRVSRYTPNGLFIDLGFGEERFIANRWKKKYAYDTVTEAAKAFYYRKEKQRFILARQIHGMNDILAAAQQIAGMNEEELLRQDHRVYERWSTDGYGRLTDNIKQLDDSREGDYLND